MLSLLTQVNRKLDFDETTSFPETKTGDDTDVSVNNPVYRNQTKPKSSRKPRNRVTLLTRVITSTAVLNVQQLDAFGAQKGKEPGTWLFPSTPIKSGCSSEPVSYRSEHK